MQGVLARGERGGDHPTVPILLALGSEAIAVLYVLAIIMLVGATAFHFLVWRKVTLPIGPVRRATDEQMFSLVVQTGTWSAAALLALLAPRAAGVSALLDDRYSLRTRLDALLLRSEWGIGFAAMAAAGLVSLAGFLLLRRHRMLGWPLVIAGVPLVAVGAGLQGHPWDAFANMTAAPIFDGIHAVAVGGWLGSFFLLVLAERRVQQHTSSPWTDPLGAMLERYFRASGALATLVLLTGLFSSSTHLTGFDDIEGTPYGRLLAGKVAIVLILMAFNEHHRRHAERQARTDERPRLVHTMRFEVGIIVLITALTVLLVDTTPPGANEVRTEVFRSASSGSADASDAEIGR